MVALRSESTPVTALYRCQFPLLSLYSTREPETAAVPGAPGDGETVVSGVGADGSSRIRLLVALAYRVRRPEMFFDVPDGWLKPLASVTTRLAEAPASRVPALSVSERSHSGPASGESVAVDGESSLHATRPGVNATPVASVGAVDSVSRVLCDVDGGVREAIPAVAAASPLKIRLVPSLVTVLTGIAVPVEIVVTDPPPQGS